MFIRGRQRRRKLSAEETAANAAAKADRAKRAMTCQICGRPILAETGVIAHHGYERPEMGWQTSSCPGARRLPFEASCEDLRKHIEGQRDYVANLEVRIGKIGRDELPVIVSLGSKGTGRQRVPVTVAVTPITFDAVKEANLGSFISYGVYDFAKAKARYLDQIERERTARLDYIRGQEERLRAWTQTHERVDGAWREVGQ